jgi:prepilin-type N-terminal cleavage/methylation domain-containing protein
MPGLHQSPRRGVTLIELLVVIVLITVLATLVAVYVVPSFQDNRNVVRGVDRVIITLLTAKQRALRDRQPRGVRFLTDTDPSSATNGQIIMQYVEQPDPYRAGMATVVSGRKTVTVSATASPASGPIDFAGGAALDPAGLGTTDYAVQPFDYFRLEMNSPAQNYQIRRVNAQTSTLTLDTPLLPGVTTKPPQTFQTLMYQIVRQTRPISGESPVTLPQNVTIDLATVASVAPANQVPFPFGGNPAYQPPNTPVQEIMFDVSGAVMNQTGSTILLLVRDSTAANALDPNLGRVIAVYPRTGMVAAHPIAPSTTNPFSFALDGKSSGM